MVANDHVAGSRAPATNAALLSKNVYREWRRVIDAKQNLEVLHRTLATIQNESELVQFLYQFLLFNDALAPRVPYLAGLIHRSSGVFSAGNQRPEFCQRRNAQVAAFVAGAAQDEYRVTRHRSMVHQTLAQRLFARVLKHYAIRQDKLAEQLVSSNNLERILVAARDTFFDSETDTNIFAALGFHVALEFFASEEFQTVDSYLRTCHPDLVESLAGKSSRENAYLWMSIHAKVEAAHHRAAVRGTRTALRYYAHPERLPLMADRLIVGFNAFAELQRQFYERGVETAPPRAA